MPSYYISHSSIPGRQNGVRHGPPYPIDASIRAAMAARSKMAEKLQASKSKEKAHTGNVEELYKIRKEETKYAKGLQKQNEKILKYLKEPVTGNLQYDNDQVNRALNKYGEKKIKDLTGRIDPWTNRYDSDPNSISNKSGYMQAKQRYCLEKYKNDAINPDPSSVNSWRTPAKGKANNIIRYGDFQYIILDAIKQGIAEGKSEAQIGSMMDKIYKKYQNASPSELRSARNNTTSYKKIQIKDNIRSEALKDYYKNRICGREAYNYSYMDEYDWNPDLIDRINKELGRTEFTYPAYMRK